MRLPGPLRRLLARRPSRQSADEARYAAAAELEKATQSHYRSVTSSDSSGRPTKKPD